MDLLLLSINVGAVPHFLDECVGRLPRPLRLGYVSDAAVGMPFAERERAGVQNLGHDLVEICVRDLTADEFGELLDSLDAVYVAGGEPFVLLEALRSNGTGDVLAERVRGGLPYIGCSAGSTITGPSITPVELMDSRDAAPDLRSDEGLHFIEQVIIPHADGQLPPYPPELINEVVSSYAERYPLLMLRDDQALRVSAEGSAIVTSR